MKFINQVSRILMGLLFIFSGSVKLNDPYGTAYMLEDYFEVFASDFTSLFHHLVPFSIYFSVIICAFEVILGIAILLQYRMRLTMSVALLLTLFFTFLTFYSFYFDKVKECGCFGTVIKMNPEESFYKNIVTLVFILILYFQRNKLKPLIPGAKGDVVIVFVSIFFIGIGCYIMQHLPLIDNLSYRVGNNLPRLMQPEEKARYKWILEKDGKEYEFDDSNYPTDTNYKYKSHELIGDSAKMIPEIVGLRIEGEEGDVTAEVFKGNTLLIVIPYSAKARDNCSGACMDKINKLVKYLDTSKEAKVMALTGHSNATIFEDYRHDIQLAAPYFYTDETVLKTMVRSNPGLLLLKDGIVKGKWHYNDTPDPAIISELLKE
jgi:uncharacterized membrane protein YphA (DoxX/SURF4 family)